jgi:plasmid stability protein
MNMSTLTVSLPDDKHERLRTLAARRKVSVNKLIEELSTQALAEFDSEVRFRALAASGRVRKGLDVLVKLDAQFGSDQVHSTHASSVN